MSERLHLAGTKASDFEHYKFELTEKGKSEIIGIFSLCADKRSESYGDIGGRIFEKYQDRGFGTEALNAVKDFALSIGVQPYVSTDDANLSAVRIAEKAGFVIQSDRMPGRHRYDLEP